MGTSFNRRTMAFASAVVVFLGIGVVVWQVWGNTPPRHPVSLDSAAAREEERAHLIKEWQSSRAVSITSSDLDRVIDDVVRTQGQTQPPPKTTPVTVESLEHVRRAELAVAVRDLLRAYSPGSGEALSDYMASRDEELSPEFASSLKTTLTAEHGVKVSAATVMPTRELVSQYWKAVKCQPSWEAVLVGHGGVTLWSTATVPAKDAGASHFARTKDNKAFGNMVSPPHIFRPRVRSLADAVNADKTVLFADVRIVIRYSQDRFGEPRPHYFRFWYDTKSARWHPMYMALICTVSQEYPKLIF